MSDLSQKLHQWLVAHDQQLSRYSYPVPLSIVGQEINEPPDRIQQFLQQDIQPCYHLWPHLYRGQYSPSKPYCLRLNGPNTVGLDWEESVAGAAEAVFQRMNYQTAREIGTERHLSSLLRNPDLSTLGPVANQRDLWALKKVGNEIDLYIVEAKGKQAYGFEHYCFAEVLSQVFPVPGELLSALLGQPKGDGHGLCWQSAQRLYNGWKASGFKPTITVAILLPEWSPDVVWSSSKARQISGSFYERPLADFRRFLSTGETESKIGRHKYQRLFGEVLDGLEATYRIRTLNQAMNGLRFRVMTTRLSQMTRAFEVTGL